MTRIDIVLGNLAQLAHGSVDEGLKIAFAAGGLS